MKKNDSKKFNIHDRLFKQSFSHPEVSIDLFRHHLPSEVFNKIDLSTLRLSNKTFISEEHDEKHSDLVFKAKIDGLDGYLYLLAEHQSTNDKFIGVRLLEYNAAIIREHMIQYKTSKAPVVINILVYAGSKPYNGPTHMSEMFDNPELANQLMFKDIHLVDLHSMEVSQLKNDGKASVAEILLKLGVMRDIHRYLDEYADVLKAIINEVPYLDKATDYIFYLDSGNNTKKIVNLLKEITQNEDLVMTLAQHFKNEGRIEGRNEGRIEGRNEGRIEGRNEAVIKTARNLLKHGASIELIKKSTGLSLQDIEETPTVH